MRYGVEITRRAAKQFDSLPPDAQRQINKLFDLLAENPRSHKTIKMHGLDNLYRMRTGNWRVVYEIRDNVLLVLIVAVGHRRDVYQSF